MPPYTISCDLKARIPILFFEQDFTVDQICVILGVKKSLVYKSLQYFRAYGTAHNPHARKTGRSRTLSPLDIKFIAALVAQRHCIYLDEIHQALSEQHGCMVSMADAATANIPTPISSSPPSTLVTQWWEGVHTSDAVCHILRTGQSLPLTTRSSRWTCIWHHICPPDLLIPASYQDGRVHGRRTHQYSCYTLTGRSSLLCSGWLRLRMPGQRQRKLVNVVDTFQAQRGDKSRAMP